MHCEINYKIDTLPGPRCRIRNYLRSLGYSIPSLTELKKDPQGVLLNGTPSFMNQFLTIGDTLTIHIEENISSEHVHPVKLPLHILYEDDHLIVVNKPAGMPIHPSANNHDNSLASALAYYYQSQGIPFIFRCMNRLDRDTSGVTVISKHHVAAGILAQDIRAHHLTRQYLAIVSGTDLPDLGTIDAPLGRKPGSVIERTIDPEHGERAITHYKVLKRENGHSLVSLILETGRTHQIRIHMKYLGYPLIGDYLYHPDMRYICRQALHSYQMTFTHPITREEVTFTADLPEDMLKVICL